MNDWPPPSRDDHLDRADDLLGQADALLRRHRGQSDIEAQPAEKLVELDTEIARKVADWVAVEFQQVLDRELERLGERVRAEMLAHLRATLLPELSAQVSTLLDDSARPSATPDRS